VQKIYFNFAVAKTIVYSFQSRYWQGFGNDAVKLNTGNAFRGYNAYCFQFAGCPFSLETLSLAVSG
jgi:hypothetical protein